MTAAVALCLIVAGVVYALVTGLWTGEGPLTTEASEPPEGMVWIPGGSFRMGEQDPRFADAQPIHTVHVDGFWMDRTEVTNDQFARFVHATGYQTVAE